MSSFVNKSNNLKPVYSNTVIKGFTLVELMVTIAVAAIMISIAIPSLSGFTTKMRIDNEISQLNRLVLAARNTTISTGQGVTLCPLDVNNICTNNWGDELSLFIDLNRNGVFEPAPPVVPPVPSEILLKVKQANTSLDVITYGQNRITFAPTGTLANVAGTFLYCPQIDNTLGRAIVLATSGRTFVTTDADNDGIDEFRGGGPVNCP